jgi:Flp pilus assembly protein TadD
MRTLLNFLAVMMLLVAPMTVWADEGPMKLPAGANAEAAKHNDEGISHFGQGHFDVALKHFQGAAKADPSTAEICFNEGLAYDKMGNHGEATEHFKKAKESAKGNQAILNSAILNAHLKH